MVFKLLVLTEDNEVVRWEEGGNRTFKPTHYEVVVSFAENSPECKYEVLQVVLPKELYSRPHSRSQQQAVQRRHQRDRPLQDRHERLLGRLGRRGLRELL